MCSIGLAHVRSPWLKPLSHSSHSSKDDWIRVLVHLSGLRLLARSFNSGRVLPLTENGARCQIQPRIAIVLRAIALDGLPHLNASAIWIDREGSFFYH